MAQILVGELLYPWWSDVFRKAEAALAEPRDEQPQDATDEEYYTPTN